MKRIEFDENIDYGARSRAHRYRPYGLEPGERRPLAPAQDLPDERAGWSAEDHAEAAAEDRAAWADT